MNGLMRYWPIGVAALAIAIAAGESRLAIAENDKEIASLRSQQREIAESLKEQAEVNGRIEERTQQIQDQLRALLQAVRGHGFR